MQRICKYCGVEFNGRPDSAACPECVAKNKSTTMRERVCRNCGVTFQGGPRARYCPGCRADRKREQDRKYKKVGSSRKIGSEDLCEICGKPYIVNSGLQKYCKDCADEAVKAIDRQQALEWQKENTAPDKRRESRQAGTAPIVCPVCGKSFVPRGKRLTCSDECKASYTKMQMAKWEKEHQNQRNEYHRKLRKNKKEFNNENDN